MLQCEIGAGAPPSFLLFQLSLRANPEPLRARACAHTHLQHADLSVMMVKSIFGCEQSSSSSSSPSPGLPADGCQRLLPALGSRREPGENLGLPEERRRHQHLQPGKTFPTRRPRRRSVAGTLSSASALQNGLNALHLASKEGHVEVVAELIKLGANVDAATKVCVCVSRPLVPVPASVCPA